MKNGHVDPNRIERDSILHPYYVIFLQNIIKIQY